MSKIGKFDFSNTVTITPIPKNHQPQQPSQPQASNSSLTSPTHDFPNKSNLNGGVEIRMVVPTQTAENSPKRAPDTMKLSLEDIIIAGLNKKPEETNYKCTKAFAEQFDQVVPKANASNQRQSFDTEHGSPGDSDYESAQEGLPFKIRKNLGSKKPINTSPQSTSVPSIDLKIQKSIKDFFQAE